MRGWMSLADHRHRQRRTGHNTKRRRSQRIDPLGMKIVIVDSVNERPNILQLAAKPPIHLPHNAPKAKTSTYWGYSSNVAQYLGRKNEGSREVSGPLQRA